MWLPDIAFLLTSKTKVGFTLRSRKHMYAHVVILLILCPFICSEFVAKQKSNFPKSRFETLAKLAHNDSRTVEIQRVLNEASGVYVNKDSKRSLNLSKTVFMSVAAFNQKGIAHYKTYFRNFLCFIQHFEIDLVLYILHHDPIELAREVKEFAELGVRVLPFPEELFWQVLSTKKSPVKTGKGFADYTGDTPSFIAHGALVMLIPVLEALELGHNVIFFDVDIGLVQDPVPFLTANNADFVSSQEIRHCAEFFSASRPHHVDWQAVEPNTGVMHVRATVQGRRLFRTWLERIVDSNFMNDQRAFDRKALGAVYSDSCLRYNHSSRAQDVQLSGARAPTYCFLSEALFQNGMVAVQCPMKAALRDDWVLQMHQLGTPGYSNITKEALGARYPVAVHTNYCKGKSLELQLRGLWLLQDQYQNLSAAASCRPYIMSTTYYASAMNWTAEVAAIQVKRLAQFDLVIRNGSLVQSTSGKEVFLIDERRQRRQVPDKNTFEALFGEDWGLVRVVPTEVLDRVELGPPLPLHVAK